MNHTNSEPLLEVRNLKKYFGKKGRILHAVDDISVSIGRGKTLGVVGESGCGKSTLGRTVLRLLEPTGGQILFEGKDITHVGKPEMRRYRQSMQIVFQDPYSSLNPRKSVAEIIATPLKVNHICKSRADLQKRVRELMDTVGLAERLYDAYPHELDGGRRQRICIARALAIRPKFIVCDEPVSALDVSIQAQILNLLMDLQDEMGLTYLFITHDLSVVKHISSDIMVMYMGSCVEYASLYQGAAVGHSGSGHLNAEPEDPAYPRRGGQPHQPPAGLPVRAPLRLRLCPVHRAGGAASMARGTCRRLLPAE